MRVAERIIGLLDRNTSSKTYGCFDRGFWKYFVTDYPSSWFQAGVEYLSWLHKVPHTPFCGNEYVSTWVQASLEFTVNWLNDDGSTMEVYPFEKSFCATSFVAGHCAKSAMDLRIDVPEVKRMGDFLCDNLGNQISNQIAAAALAQFRLGKMFDDAGFTQDALVKLETLYNGQHRDGYFPEYGGCDLGYLSITVSLLARIEKEFPQMVDRKRVRKAVHFIDTNCDEDGWYNYSAMSRKTQFLYPFGVVFFDEAMIDKIDNGLKSKKIVEPAWLDDRYVAELAIDYFYFWDELK